MATKNTTAYAEIVKFDEQEDGTVIAYGKATDATLDSDEQICDPEWLKRAMPEWFKYGNIREQHSSIAAGVATEYEEKDGGHFITAHIVDANSAKKIKTGVLKGFSIGIRRPRVIKDNKALGGRIVDGEIVEISVVDRPANPACTLVVAKAVGGVMTQVEEYTEKGSPDQERDERGRFSSDGGSSDEPYLGEKRDFGTWDNPNYEEIESAVSEHMDSATDLQSETERLANEPSNSEGSYESEDESDINQALEEVNNGNESLSNAQTALQFHDVIGHLEAAATSFRNASNYLENANSEAGSDAQILSDEIRNTVTQMQDSNQGKYAKARKTAADIGKGSPDQPRDENGRFASTNDSLDRQSAALGEENRNALAAAEYAVAERALNEVMAEDSGSYATGDNVAAAQDIADKYYADHELFVGNGQPASEESEYARGSAETAQRVVDASGEKEATDMFNNARDMMDRAWADRSVSALIRGYISGQYNGVQHAFLARFGYFPGTKGLKAISTAVNKYADTDIKKFDQGAFDTARRALATLIQVEAGEMADGSDETYSLSCLLQAVHSLMCWYEGEEEEGETMEMPEGIEMSNEPDLEKGSPDQARDDHGRFTSDGGSVSAETSQANSERINESREATSRLVQDANNVVTSLRESGDLSPRESGRIAEVNATLQSVERDIQGSHFARAEIKLSNEADRVSPLTRDSKLSSSARELYSDLYSTLRSAADNCMTASNLQGGRISVSADGRDYVAGPNAKSVDSESKADEVEDGACKDCGEKECKCAEGGYVATEKSADAELRDTIMEIVKSLLPTEVGEEDKTKAAESVRIEVLEAELAQVKSLAAPNGPRRFGAVSSTSKEQLNKAKAQQYRAKADLTLDKALADGYRQMARDLETNSNPTKGDANNGN